MSKICLTQYKLERNSVAEYSLIAIQGTNMLKLSLLVSFQSNTFSKVHFLYYFVRLVLLLESLLRQMQASMAATEALEDIEDMEATDMAMDFMVRGKLTPHLRQMLNQMLDYFMVDMDLDMPIPLLLPIMV